MESCPRKKDVPVFLWRHVPADLPDILVDLTREILRSQPKNIYNFAANYFEKVHCLHKKSVSPAGAEINEEQKEESASEKDGVPAPSSPSQDTMVTVASGGSDKVQESPTKPGAPLAREEESFTQQASPVAEKPKVDTKQDGESKTVDAEVPEPEVKELQRVNETKLEKEKSVDTSGVTTEKTVYTQVSESVTIQETKGPIVDPFSSSQKTVFPPFSKSWQESRPRATESQTLPSYVHSVKVTESSSSTPSSPASFSEGVPENVASVPEKGEVSEKTEVVEMSTDVAGNLEMTSPIVSHKEYQAQVEQETPGSEVIYEEQVGDDTERSDVEGAVVKIQAGIRGYLTRKSLKESRKDGPLMHSGKGGASVQPSSKQDEIPSEEPPVLSTEAMEIISDTLDNELGESNAAVKIQAMYRGYRTRKQLDELLNESCDEEIETLITGAEEEYTVQENRRSPPDRSPVIVTENFVPILKARVTITPPSSPTITKDNRSTTISSVEVAPEDSKSAAIPETFGDTDETAKADTPVVVDDDDEDEESKKQAATKIQAVFRGYKVRKTSRKEASGTVKEIPGDTEENVELDSPKVLGETPSPPFEPENEDDMLDDDAEDDNDEIPSFQWQTSELYADDQSSPKQPHQHDESKTESFTEEATAPVADSPKTTQMSSEQVVRSTAKISLAESHESATPTTIEDEDKSH